MHTITIDRKATIPCPAKDPVFGINKIVSFTLSELKTYQGHVLGVYHDTESWYYMISYVDGGEVVEVPEGNVFIETP
jgi:hypothetical protein